jgi:ATP adenylyltransferase
MPEVLFAPWRYEYLVAEKSERCIFCEAAGSGNDEESLVVHRGRRVFVLLNRYPYTNGHLMIAPYEHHAHLSDSEDETLSELIGLVAVGEKILIDAYRADGLNIGVNLGSAAGAGVSDHYHVHLVPRWSGDTNFMTVAGGVRVVPEELSQTRRRLLPLFAGAAR